MQAFQVFSHNEAPRLAEMPDASPDAGQIRVRIHACGLNFADLLMARGKYQDTPALPFALGMEVAGEVDARSSMYAVQLRSC